MVFGGFSQKGPTPPGGPKSWFGILELGKGGGFLWERRGPKFWDFSPYWEVDLGAKSAVLKPFFGFAKNFGFLRRKILPQLGFLKKKKMGVFF